MVFLGGTTRLTHSGLSMVNWSLFGSVPPSNQVEWNNLFEQYKQYPEYQQVNFNFSVEEFKSIFWWEYIHRLIGRLMGILFLVPFLYFLITKKLSNKLIVQLSVLFIMGIVQGLLGWYMVKSGLVNEPDVSHYRLAIHLFAAFFTFSYTFWIALNVKFLNVQEPTFPKVKNMLWVLLPLLLLQIIYGAFVAGTNGGMVYNTWPKMGNDWLPEGVTVLSPVYLNFIEGIAGIQFIHRYLAYAVVLIVFYIWFSTRKINISKTQKSGINAMLYLVIVQFILGVFTLLYSVPLSLGVLHQLGAFVLLATVVFCLNRFSFKHS
jgi:cytochrome c oxidase assembly protein subunit 15